MSSEEAKKMKTVGERLKELRLNGGFTQQDIADELQIDRSNYSKYELGKLEISIEMLIALAKFYGVTADYIIGLED